MYWIVPFMVTMLIVSICTLFCVIITRDIKPKNNPFSTEADYDER